MDKMSSLWPLTWKDNTPKKHASREIVKNRYINSIVEASQEASAR